MSSQTPQPIELGAIKPRKPNIAFNLSFLLAGLGQIYCGCFQRGLVHLAIISGLLVAGIVLLATQFPYLLTVCIVTCVIVTIVSAYSAFDARKLARQCRPDYRLKDYNTILTYSAISFLFLSLVIGFSFTLRENFLHAFKMVGNSMDKTLVDGQHVFVRKDAYLRADPQHYDLIAFRSPENRQQVWVKRVIGLPGDVIEIHNGVVKVNGSAIKEMSRVTKDNANLDPITVPKNHCYVLGDNRAHSKDSRYLGPISMNALVGKVIGHR